MAAAVTDKDIRLGRHAMTTHDPLPELRRATEFDFAEEVVKLLLKRYRISKEHRLAMLEESERRFGTRHLSLDLFLKFFPTFPMVLQCVYIWQIAKRISIADLFGNFGRTPLVQFYEEFYKTAVEDTDSRSFGLVFNWPHVRGGLVLHNHVIDTRVDGTRLLWTSQNRQLVVETLGVVLDTLDSEVAGGKGWQPEIAP